MYAVSDRSTEASVRSGCFFAHRTRIVILILSTICLTAVQSNSLALNFTIICMDDVIPIKLNNSTLTEVSHWLLSPYHINFLFSAIAIGSLAGTLPIMTCITYLGIRNTLTIYGLISATATLLLPFAVDLGYYYIFAIRILQGFSIGITFSAMGAIASQWSALKEAGTYIAILSTHIQLSSIFTMPLAASLCESSFGWRSIYYLQGGITVVAFSAFYFFYQDFPHIHRHVSIKELSRIQKDKIEAASHTRVPYFAVARDPCIIGVWLSCLGGNLAFLIFLYYGPTYMNKVLHYDISSTGMATALPYMLSAILKFLAGPLSDNTVCLSERARVILFASASQGVMALCFCTLAYTTSTMLAQIAYTTAIVFSGLNVVGVVKCAQMVSRQHVHLVMVVISFGACIITLLLPAIMTVLCPDNTRSQWSRLFSGISIVIVVMNIPFVFLAQSKPAPWTEVNYIKNKVGIIVHTSEDTKATDSKHDNDKNVDISNIKV